MDAYERSLKQQADRIRRELSQEGKKGAPAPKICAVGCTVSDLWIRPTETENHLAD